MSRVDPKAILEGRVPGRAPVGLIFGLVFCSLCMIMALGIEAVNGASFFVGLALAILPVPLLISLVLMLDRLEPEPWRALVFAFMWGAGVAVLGALLLNTYGLYYVTGPLFGSQKGEFVSAVVGAPIIEESLKGSVLFGFLWFRRNELDGLTDGIVYAAMVALGFAMLENVTYYMRAAGEHDLEGVFILRGVVAPLGHPIFTSMTGIGVAYAALNRGAVRIAAPIAGLATAMLLHGAWNFSSSFHAGGLAIAYGIDFLVVVGLLLIVLRERTATVRLIERYLPAYSGTGLVTPQDVRMLGSLPLRRRARQWARTVGGRPAARAMADYQLAATELALAHQRAERGVAEPSWFYQRRQSLLQLMQLARQAFQSGQASQSPPWVSQGRSGLQHPGQSYGPPPPGPFAN